MHDGARLKNGGDFLDELRLKIKGERGLTQELVDYFGIDRSTLDGQLLGDSTIMIEVIQRALYVLIKRGRPGGRMLGSMWAGEGLKLELDSDAVRCGDLAMETLDLASCVGLICDQVRQITDPKSPGGRRIDRTERAQAEATLELLDRLKAEISEAQAALTKEMQAAGLACR